MYKRIYKGILQSRQKIRQSILLLYPMGFLMVILFPGSFREASQLGIQMMQQNMNISVSFLMFICLARILAMFPSPHRKVVHYIGYVGIIALALHITITAFADFKFSPGFSAHLTILLLTVHEMWQDEIMPTPV